MEARVIYHSGFFCLEYMLSFFDGLSVYEFVPDVSIL